VYEPPLQFIRNNRGEFMSWLKSNAVPLLVGVAVGYFVAKSGGFRGAVAKVQSKA
jgi:hypothetical protein